MEGVERLKASPDGFGKDWKTLDRERAVWQEQRLLFLDIVGNVFGIFPCFISLLPLFLKTNQNKKKKKRNFIDSERCVRSPCPELLNDS